MNCMHIIYSSCYHQSNQCGVKGLQGRLKPHCDLDNSLDTLRCCNPQTHNRAEIFRHLRLLPSVSPPAGATHYYQYTFRPLLNDNNTHRTLGSSQRQPTAGWRPTSSPRATPSPVSTGTAHVWVESMNIISSIRQSSIRVSKDNRFPDSSTLYEGTNESISKSAE